jgi:hypothetical protein
MLERAHDGWVGFGGGWCRVGVGQISSMNTRGKPRRKNIWVGVSKQREEGMGLSMSTPTLRTRHHNMMGRPHRTREGVTRPRWRARRHPEYSKSPQVFDVLPKGERKLVKKPLCIFPPVSTHTT